MKSLSRVARSFTAGTVLIAILGMVIGAAPGSARKVTLTDANIAAIVVAANTIDIENGKLAQEKSTNESVKAFAQMMITDHTSVNDKATALASKLSLTPVPNATSRGLETSMTKKRNALAKKTGAAFDRGYLDNEISLHQSVISMLDKKLIPSAKNVELKDLLTSVRPAFVSHLQHARQTRAALKR